MGKDNQNKELGPGISQRKSDNRYMVRYKGYCKYTNTLPEARAALADMIQKIDQDTYLHDTITLNHYFETFQSSRLKTKAVKESTLKSEKTMFKTHIGPALGRKKMGKISVGDVRKFQSDLLDKKTKKGDPLAISTINKIMYCLEKIMNAAVRDEVIMRNPVCKVPKLKDTREKRSRDTNHRALNTKERSLFKQYAQKSWYGNALIFMLYTGLRQGEVRALRWKDIDTDVIHIRSTMSYDLKNQPVITTPKTRTSYRDIPMNDNIMRVLQQQKEQDAVLNREYKQRSSADDFVFRTPNNLPIRDVRRLNEAIHAIECWIEADGIEFPHISSHALRATFASMAIDAGMSPETLKEILGHSSYQMTMDLYYHNSDRKRHDEMQRLNESPEDEDVAV
jgi:integrase